MHDAFCGGDVPRHVQGTAYHLAALPMLTVPAPALMAGCLPLRIIGLGGNDFDVMTARCKPRRHLAGIFSDACEFRRKIETDDDDLHRSTRLSLRCAIAALVSVLQT